MKKYLFGALAITLAVGFSAFNKNSTSKFATRYLVFNSGTENYAGSYNQQSSAPATCQGSNKICWIKVDDMDGNGTIDQNELDAFINASGSPDTDHDGNFSEETELSGSLEKKQ